MFLHHPSDIASVSSERRARLRGDHGDAGLRRRVAAALIAAGERLTPEPRPRCRPAGPAPAGPLEGPQARRGRQQAAVRA